MLNYLAWIANLGVVPLFLFLAFLFVPAAFFLLALLIDVTAVLETMVILLPNHLYHLKLLHLRAHKVANIPQCVKIIIPILLLFQLGSTVKAQNLIEIPVGEVVSVPVGHIASYEIKHPEMLVSLYEPLGAQLKIKAHQELETEILTTNAISGTQNLLKIKAINSQFIHQLSQYQLRLKASRNKNFNPQSFNNLNLIPTLKKELWMKIQKILHQSNYQDMRCEFEGIYLKCIHRYQNEDLKEFQKELQKNFLIQFIKVAKNTTGKNYQIKLKLISLENSEGLDLNLGLDQLSGSLSDFFNFPIREIAGKNSVLLNKNQTQMSVLGEPVITALLNHESIFSIGQDLPFRVRGENGRSAVQFRFAGLFLKIKLQQTGELYKIDYQTELTKPEAMGEEVSISGNKQNGAIVINDGHALKLFEIEFQTDQKNKSSFPGLSAVPVLGEIFTSRNNSQTRKKIIGLVMLNELSGEH